MCGLFTSSVYTLTEGLFKGDLIRRCSTWTSLGKTTPNDLSCDWHVTMARCTAVAVQLLLKATTLSKKHCHRFSQFFSF